MAITALPSSDGQELTIHIQGRFDFSAHQEFRDAYERVSATPKRYGSATPKPRKPPHGQPVACWH